MRRALLAGNWKLNPASAGEASELARAIKASASAHAEFVQVAIFPPFPWLLGVAETVLDSPVELGAQDCYWEPRGAFTGEVSAAMLQGWCRWVIVGHSERRRLFAETDQVVAKKAAAAIAAGLSTIICVGESEQAFESGRCEEVVQAQVRSALQELAADDSSRLLLAYEPLWAIGTGRSADPEHAYRVMRLIRRTVGECIGEGAARRTRVLYGGSANADSVPSFVELPWCDGCLVGGASLDGAEFSKMIVAAATVYRGRPVA